MGLHWNPHLVAIFPVAKQTNHISHVGGWIFMEKQAKPSHIAHSQTKVKHRLKTTNCAETLNQMVWHRSIQPFGFQLLCLFQMRHSVRVCFDVCLNNCSQFTKLRGKCRLENTIPASASTHRLQFHLNLITLHLASVFSGNLNLMICYMNGFMENFRWDLHFEI